MICTFTPLKIAVYNKTETLERTGRRVGTPSECAVTIQWFRSFGILDPAGEMNIRNKSANFFDMGKLDLAKNFCPKLFGASPNTTFNNSSCSNSQIDVRNETKKL